MRKTKETKSIVSGRIVRGSQRLTENELELALKLLYLEFPKLLKKINFIKGQSETICGMISDKITEYLRVKLGINAFQYRGNYDGRGTEFSGGKCGTTHSWVELKVLLDTVYNRSEIELIIDGAYAQFYPFHLTPNFLRDKLRLTIFINDKQAREWYKGNRKNCTDYRKKRGLHLRLLTEKEEVLLTSPASPER